MVATYKRDCGSGRVEQIIDETCLVLIVFNNKTHSYRNSEMISVQNSLADKMSGNFKGQMQ